MINKYFLLALFLIASSTSGIVNAQEPTPVEAAKALATMKNISVEDALNIINKDEKIADIVAMVRQNLRGKVAGVYAEYTPKFTLVVRIKGQENLATKAIKTFAGNSVPIRFETGQDNAVEELVQAYDSKTELIKAILPTVQGIGINEETGKIVISVLEQDNQKIGVQEQINKLIGHPVDIVVQNEPTTNANLRGGAKISSPSSYCTTGFVVKNTTGATGIATSAHCEGMNTYTDYAGNTIPLNLIPNTELYTSRQDVEIHTGSKSGVAQFYGASKSLPITVTGRVSRASTYANMPVCHRGMTTGYSCGLVENTNYKPVYKDACGKNNEPCDSTWVTVRPDSKKSLACFQGDSGGFVFTADSNKAVGLLKATSAAGKAAGQCNFFIYMSLDYLPAGWSVLYGT